jgi:hypothetical protein
MRSRRVVAAVAGVTGAVIAHALDVAGLLPFVHESVEVRTGMGAAATIGWLALAAVLAALTARRPATAGAVAALVIGGLPELAGRHDPGAMFEPSAMAGALLQWLLLVLVLSIAYAVHTRLTTSEPSPTALPTLRLTTSLRRRRHFGRTTGRSGRTRAPPASRVTSWTVIFQRGTRCTEVCATASSRWASSPRSS